MLFIIFMITFSFLSALFIGHLLLTKAWLRVLRYIHGVRRK